MYVSDVISPQYSPALRISGPEDCYEVLRNHLDKLDRERFYVMTLSTKNDVLGIKLVSIGTLTATIVHPREVFKPAITTKAARIVLAHNHPSGDPSPSDEDIKFTRRMVDAGILLDIPVLDHLIVGSQDCYYSFSKSGGLDYDAKTSS